MASSIVTLEDSSQFGFAAAVELRAKTAPVRALLMGAIAAMLWSIGHWSWAPVWFGVYLAMQALSAVVGPWSARVLPEISDEIACAMAALNFAIVGVPTWYMWTRCGDLGVAAAIMFLCGMLAQLIVGSLGSRRLFWSSAAPLIAYLILLPPIAFGPRHLDEGLTVSACAVLLVTYLAVLWAGHQKALEELEYSRFDAIRSKSLAEDANRAKSAFLAMMSHEVRTPMNAVLGAADLLKRTALNIEQRDHVEMISNAGAVLMQVLNDILDLSKIEAGKLDIEFSDIELHEFVRRCVALWRPRALDKGLSFDLVIDPGAPQFVIIDATRTGQILFNLFSNAIKFTSVGGVTVRVATQVADGDDFSLVFEVRDTGDGIAADALPRLFTAFQQADQSISRRFGGTGLGLSISQKLAEMMGGDIAVTSTEGHGATFTLTLPSKAGTPLEDETRSGPAAPAERNGAAIRILVAEDNPANQRIVELFLAPIGASLTIVEDGQQALDALAASPFDIVLMDMHMPNVDGLEATRRLRASGGPNAGIPVLALTANVMEDQQRACREAGMDAHVAKPIDPRVLIAAVLSAFDVQLDADDDTPAQDARQA